MPVCTPAPRRYSPARWKTLGTPELTAEFTARIVDGVRRISAGRSVAELAAARDETLLRLAEILRREA